MSYQNAFIGSLVADAVSMPVHWYYNRNAIDSDYGAFDHFMNPKNPHPDSILWRSKYETTNKKDDILHEQSKYWGQKGIHYHQFLKAGENSLNLKLACELYRTIIKCGEFNIQVWLERYTEVMLTPGWHSDTYAEEYHRAFFKNYARGKKLSNCGIKDIHIGGLSLVPALLAGLEALDKTEENYLLDCTQELVQGTHTHPVTISTAKDLTRILLALNKRAEIRSTLQTLRLSNVPLTSIKKWEGMPDRKVVGEILSPACYLPESFTAALYFTWKYSDDFSLAILANAKVGGDNCHRGVVVGSIVGMQTGIPRKWLQDLVAMEELRCDIS
ncbi:ADP-ribosylglycohydrolase family protein [Opitutales bacterium]|nr:ADP-ribosylglycohydrolase family protein [Opitutales bacterium]